MAEQAANAAKARLVGFLLGLGLYTEAHTVTGGATINLLERVNNANESDRQ